VYVISKRSVPKKYIGIINANCKEQEDGGGIIKRPPLKKAA
jgi:hypothetical protein